MTKKPSESKLRKEDILSGAANYIKALMAELEDVKAMMAKDVEVRNKYRAVPNTINFQGGYSGHLLISEGGSNKFNWS